MEYTIMDCSLDLGRQGKCAGACCVYQSHAFKAVETQASLQDGETQTAWLTVDASEETGRIIPETLFGIFYEEINHAGAGGLWAELVSNRGFEAGGTSIPSNIDPWSIIGDESSVTVSTDRSSQFYRNPVALRMDVLCDSNVCPPGGVGVYNPGYWGMNIEGGKKYKVVLYVRSMGAINVAVSFMNSNGSEILASANITASSSDAQNWTRKEVVLEAKGTDPHARLQLTTATKGVIWFDQVSAMPLDTKRNYKGNYLSFYNAIKRAYPDVKMISNCDGSEKQLDHPAEYYDYHIYTNSKDMFSLAHKFDHAPREGPKAFVSEYAVTGDDAGNGTLLAAIAEAGFLIGLEKNSDVVEMASYAPLFVNVNDRRWNPDAIVFDSSRLYGTPSYWVQQVFAESSGATLLNATLQTDSSDSLIASAVAWKDKSTGKNYIKIKIVNFGSNQVTLKVSLDGVVSEFALTQTVLTSGNVMDENSFDQPNKVALHLTQLQNVAKEMEFTLSPHSFTAFDLLKNQ
ncbi:alpha-L-arabinofuranosidase 1-like [Carica papaya]|uniref:alpha-L-arabinofuranosidase 1-like n=1 Tax=Carica papaya TaxID=3649 RepID=UPI000B8D1955|nr:alpha-L-arabinofuranosidase 1-like [Carica papaya]